jgi:hypothetical protein
MFIELLKLFTAAIITTLVFMAFMYGLYMYFKPALKATANDFYPPYKRWKEMSKKVQVKKTVSSRMLSKTLVK